MLKKILKLQFVRRLFGAAVGTVVALALYTVVNAVTPVLKALLPKENEPVITDAMREQNMMRVAERARLNAGLQTAE